MSEGSKAFEFVALCAAWPPQPLADELRQRAATIDWDTVCRIVHRHRIATLVETALQNAGLEAPQPVRDRARAATFQALRHTAETVRLQRAATDEGIGVVFLKGPALAQQAFGDIALRHSKDVDLIVRPEDRERAWSLMEREGYHRRLPGPDITPEQLRLFVLKSKDSSFYHPTRGVEVEVHWRMSSSLVEEPRSPPRTINLKGAGEVFVLEDDDQFIYLCRHGSRHAWMRLKWLSDIGALLNAAPEAPDRYWRAAQEANAELAVETAVRLSARLFRTPLPAALASPPRLRVRWLTAISLKAMAADGGWAEPNQTVFGRFAEHLAVLLLAPDWRSRLACVWRIVSPVEDVLLAPLPRPLRFLYPALRAPLWVWKNVLGGRGRGAFSTRRKT